MGFISVEHVVSCLRYHSDGGGFGSPYTFSCLVTRMGKVGWVSLASGEFSSKAYRAIRKALLAEGLTSVEFVRRRRAREIKETK